MGFAPGQWLEIAEKSPPRAMIQFGSKAGEVTGLAEGLGFARDILSVEQSRKIGDETNTTDKQRQGISVVGVSY